MGCAAAPVILIRTAILTARIASCTLAPTMDLRNATDPVASGRKLAMGCVAAPAILIRTAVLTARNAGRRIAGCTPAPTMDLCNASDPVASRRAAGDGLRSSPGDSDPNDIPKFGADLLELCFRILTQPSKRHSTAGTTLQNGPASVALW